MTTGVGNLEFLGFNALRRYPIHDSAPVSSAGGELPDGILADAYIYVPASIGTRLVVSSIAVTEHLIGVTIAVAGTSFSPIAAATVERAAPPYRNVQLQPFIDGVAGWVAFAPVKNVIGSWAPTGPEVNGVYPGELLPRCVTSYPSSGVTSIRQKDRSDKLRGRISVISGQPDQLVIEKTQRTIDGVGSVPVLLFRLNEEQAGPDVFANYLGPCDKSPDAGTCRRPAIFSINDAVPDENGVIQIQIQEIQDAEMGALLTTTVIDRGAFLDFGLGAAQICAMKNARDPLAGFTSCDSPCDPPPTYPGPFEAPQ
jgi:hypothetical protein